jgi:hypothetical protein
MGAQPTNYSSTNRPASQARTAINPACQDACPATGRFLAATFTKRSRRTRSIRSLRNESLT